MANLHEPSARIGNATAERRTWAQTEGLPLPLGATWIPEEQAFNFAVYAEHAETVTLLLYCLTVWPSHS
jgi:pullulanase/glycogen debranching enzyme